MSNKITAVLTPNGETIYLQYDDEESDELIAVSSPIEDIGETGIPFVTKGTAQANVAVTMEWEFNQNKGG